MMDQTKLSAGFQPQANQNGGSETANPIVACATDNHYAMPLAVTMLTAARHLRPGSRMELFLLDGGLSDENRGRLQESWANEPLDVHWVKPDRSLVDDLVTSHHISPVAYFRILLPSIMPDEYERVLYLDSDLLVLDDLCDLWEEPIESHWCLAIPDIACPFVDAKRGLENFSKASPYLASLNPIRNYDEFGIDPRSKYFNSGVLSINLDAWRHHQLSHKMLDCLREHRRFVWCWDQYALNAILSGNWRELPLRWNLGSHAYEFPSEQCSPLSSEEFVSASEDPSIVHFTTEFKPWHFGIEHPYRSRFFEYLDETAWAGWRPERPPFRLRKWWDRQAVGIQKQLVISYRKLAALTHRPAS